MKLYYGQGTCSLALHIALRLAGADFELHRVDLRAGEQRGDAFRAISPHGLVPALVDDDGFALTESLAIAQRIAEAYPDAGLLPRTGPERYRALELMTWANGTLHGGTYALFFRPGRFASDENVYPALKEHALGKLNEQLAFADGRLAARDWGPVGKPTLPDTFLYVYGRWAGRVGVEIIDYPHYAKHMDWIAALPETQAAIEAEGLKQ